MWRNVATLTFSALRAAILATVSYGPLREHRSSWVSHALR